MGRGSVYGRQRAADGWRDGASGGGEGATAEKGGDVGECGSPALLGGGRIVAEGLEVEGDDEAFLRAGEVDERWAEGALEQGVGMIERSCEARDAVEELLVLVEGDEDGAFAPEDVDIAGDAGGGVLGDQVELKAECVELVGREGPDVTLGGEDGRAGCVEGAKRVQKRRVLGGFFEPIEIVRVLAKIDEVAGGIVRVRPGDYEDRVVGTTFNRPLREHLFIVAS